MTDPTPAEHCGDQPSIRTTRLTECVLRPGHSGSHADKTGMRWWLADLGAEALADERHAPGVTDPTPAEQRRAAAVSAVATTPDPAPTERHTANTITDDELDQLYAERDRAEAAWRSARQRAAVLSAELTRRAPLLGQSQAALVRVWALHREEYGCCAECTSSHAVLYPCPTITALDEPKEQPPSTPPAHIGNRANAEDCPACAGTNPDYPFICPGPKDA